MLYPTSLWGLDVIKKANLALRVQVAEKASKASSLYNGRLVIMVTCLVCTQETRVQLPYCPRPNRRSQLW